MLRTALRMLLGDKVKFLGLVLGVSLSTLLICQQVSIFYGLLGRASNVIDDARTVVGDAESAAIDVTASLGLAAIVIAGAAFAVQRQ